MSNINFVLAAVAARRFFEDSGDPLPFADDCACALGPGGWYVGEGEDLNDGDWVIKYTDNTFGVCPHDEFYAAFPGLTEGGP